MDVYMLASFCGELFAVCGTTDLHHTAQQHLPARPRRPDLPTVSCVGMLQ